MRSAPPACYGGNQLERPYPSATRVSTTTLDGLPILIGAQTSQIVGLAVLFVVVYAVLYKPVLKVLDERFPDRRGRPMAISHGDGTPGYSGDSYSQTPPVDIADPHKIAWYRDPVLLVTLGAVLLADQLSKHVVRNTLELYESWPAEGIFRFTRGVNSGTAFGLFPNQTAVLILASFFAIGFLFYFYRAHAFPVRMLRIAIGLQLGGAFGNLLDRVRDGVVVDFIDVGWWPVFNLADSSIVVGIVLLLVVTMYGQQPRDRKTPAAAADTAED